MRQVLERFCEGSHVNIGYDLKELGSEHLSQQMRGFWAFRSQGPIEQTRLFGFFAAKGAFIATSFRARGELSGHLWLAERSSSQARWDGISNGKSYLSAPWPVLTRAHLKEYTG
jgi:hypothetical protein